MKKEKVFGYVRVSSTSQLEQDGLGRQEQVIREYAKSNNMEIAQIYTEDFTGTEFARPVLTELMVNLEKNGHGIKTVLIEKLDRLARKLMVQEAIIANFQIHGFNLISAIEGADLLDEDDFTRVAFRQMMGVFAEYNKANLVRRLKASRDRKRARGEKADGRYGYKDTAEGKELIQIIYNLRHPEEGKRPTYREIADLLNQAGIRTMDGKLWDISRVYLTATQKKYQRKKIAK